MCEFSHLQIGETVNFTAEYCFHCDEQLFLDGPAVYKGHITDGVVYDYFVFSNPIVCPKCAELLTMSLFECKSGLEIDIQIFDLVEHEIS